MSPESSTPNITEIAYDKREREIGIDVCQVRGPLSVTVKYEETAATAQGMYLISGIQIRPINLQEPKQIEGSEGYQELSVGIGRVGRSFFAFPKILKVSGGAKVPTYLNVTHTPVSIGLEDSQHVLNLIDRNHQGYPIYTIGLSGGSNPSTGVYDKEVGLSVCVEIVRPTIGPQMIVCEVGGLYKGNQGLYSHGFRVEVPFVVFINPETTNSNPVLTVPFRASISEFSSED